MKRRIAWGAAALTAVLAFYSWLGAMGQQPPQGSSAAGDVDMAGTPNDAGSVHISTPVTAPGARPEIRGGMGVSGTTSGSAAGSVNSSGTGQGSGVGSNIGTSNSNRAE